MLPMSPLMCFNLFVMFIISLPQFTMLNYFIFPAKKNFYFSWTTKKNESDWKW